MRGKWSLMVVVGLYASACLSTLRQTLPLEFWFQHSISLGSDWFLQTSFQGCVFFSQQPTFPTLSVVQQPEKTANISCEMTPEKRAQDSTLITHHYPELSNASDLVVPHGKFASTNQKHCTDLGSDTSSVWNFCIRGETSCGATKFQLF